MPGTNEYMRQYMAERYEKRKAWAIDLLGGSCAGCGSTSDLQFDHVDPRTKSFSIGSRLAGVSQERLEEELAKCQLLCPSCHKDKSNANGEYIGPTRTTICKCGRTFVGRQYSGHRRWCNT